MLSVCFGRGLQLLSGWPMKQSKWNIDVIYADLENLHYSSPVCQKRKRKNQNKTFFCGFCQDKNVFFNTRFPLMSVFLCLKERNHLSAASVVNALETIQPWSSTCGPMEGPRRTSAPSAWSSAAAWLPCRGTSRATRCRTFPLTGASTTPTCTSPTSEPRLSDRPALYSTGVVSVNASNGGCSMDLHK